MPMKMGWRWYIQPGRISKYLKASEKLVDNIGSFFGASFSDFFTLNTTLELPRY